MSLFEKPLDDWTDLELTFSLAELAKLLAWKQDQHQDVDSIHTLARSLADERDRRTALARAVNAAMCPSFRLD
jgi:hypothetical protein